MKTEGTSVYLPLCQDRLPWLHFCREKGIFLCSHTVKDDIGNEMTQQVFVSLLDKPPQDTPDVLQRSSHV